MFSLIFKDALYLVKVFKFSEQGAEVNENDCNLSCFNDKRIWKSELTVKQFLPKHLKVMSLSQNLFPPHYRNIIVKADVINKL